MNRSQKNLAVGIGAFLLVFVVSVVYAATSGALTFNGTAEIGTNIDLDILNANVENIKTGETVNISNGQNDLNFTILFDEPNETRTVTFQIKNVGNAEAVLGTLSTTSPSAPGLSIVWPTLDGVVLAPGATSSTYSAVVTWSSDFDTEAGEEITFGASINYMAN